MHLNAGAEEGCWCFLLRKSIKKLNLIAIIMKRRNIIILKIIRVRSAHIKLVESS